MPAALSAMTDQEFAALCGVVLERSGVRVSETKKHLLESRLARRVEELGFDDYSQYVRFLTAGPYQADEFEELLGRLAVNETSFWRNQAQLDVFETLVLPNLIRDRAESRRLRIWSAGCSTGEEPYTLAMQVYRTLGARLGDWRIEILGTDTSERALAFAQEGLYTSFSFRGANPLNMGRYFREQGGRFRIDPALRGMVMFEHHNLGEALAARRHGVWDVIFCRNVLGHFDDEMRSRCVRMFHEQLAADGRLFVGHADELHGTGGVFVPADPPEGIAYRKNDTLGIGA